MLQVTAKKRLAAVFMILGIAWAAATGTAQAGEKMSGLEIRKLFPGRFAGVVNGFVNVKIIASRNGRLTGFANGKKDRGRWSISGSRLCISFQKWRDGRRQCSTVTRSGKWYRTLSVSFRKL